MPLHHGLERIILIGAWLMLLHDGCSLAATTSHDGLARLAVVPAAAAQEPGQCTGSSPQQCSFYTDESVCSQVDGCQWKGMWWHVHGGKCKGSFSCRQFDNTRSEHCENQAGCLWKDSPQGCCAGISGWCSQRSTKESCTANNKCTWFTPSEILGKAKREMGTCSGGIIPPLDCWLRTHSPIMSCTSGKGCIETHVDGDGGGSYYCEGTPAACYEYSGLASVGKRDCLSTWCEWKPKTVSCFVDDKKDNNKDQPPPSAAETADPAPDVSFTFVGALLVIMVILVMVVGSASDDYTAVRPPRPSSSSQHRRNTPNPTRRNNPTPPRLCVTHHWNAGPMPLFPVEYPEEEEEMPSPPSEHTPLLTTAVAVPIIAEVPDVAEMPIAEAVVVTVVEEDGNNDMDDGDGDVVVDTEATSRSTNMENTHPHVLDIVLNDANHPGTHDWIRAVKQVAAEGEDPHNVLYDYSPRIDETILWRLSGRKYYLANPSGDGSHRQATQEERVAWFRFRYEEERAHLVMQHHPLSQQPT